MDGPQRQRRGQNEGPGMSTPLDIIVPVVMCAALLLWIGRGMSGRAMLIATAVTLAVIVGVLLIQNHIGGR
ncbi:hypothetical protein BH10PSE10_BH10PSE10_11450 [soil metagenome]